MSKLSRNDEMEEIKGFISGDNKAFGELVNRYKERIYTVVLRMVRNRDDAKDIAQDAFVRAYRNRRSFREESGFYTWVYRIAVNLAINFLNRDRERSAYSLDDPRLGEQSTGVSDQNIDAEELRRAIDEAIAGLPARQRAVFVLRQYELKSNSEIASLLSITEGAVKANYFQAIRKLRQVLGRYLNEGSLVS